MNFDNAFHKVTMMICDENQEIVTATMIMLGFVATLDKKISNQEVAYLKHYLHHNFKVKKAFLNHAVHDYLFILQEDQQDATKLSEVRDYLRDHLTEKQKAGFLRALLGLSCSDNDLAKVEKRYVKNIALGLGLDSNQINQEFITKEFQMIQRIDEEIAQDKDLKEHPKIQFATVAEMLEDLNQRTK